MGLRSRQAISDEMPEVNLIPMLNVSLTVLAFFTMVTMSLTGQQAGVEIPSSEVGAEAVSANDPMVVNMNRQGQVLIGDRQVNETELGQQVQAFLRRSPDGTIILNADTQVSYDKVKKTLNVIQQAGGSQVSLAVQ